MANWRKSAKAKEFRDYFDKFLKPKKQGMKNLDREILVDFIAKEVDAAEKKGYQRGITRGAHIAAKL